jgi:hypothetical protein
VIRLLPFVSLAVLLLNDHVLKRAWPGFVTGKLSDVAGMIFFPVLLQVALLAVAPRRRGTTGSPDRVLAAACVLTAVVFTLTKTTALGNDAYRTVWGAMQWPLRAARAIATDRPAPALAPVVLVRDTTDLLAVPFVALAYLAGRAGRRGAISGSRRRARPGSSSSPGPSRAPASPPRPGCAI